VSWGSSVPALADHPRRSTKRDHPVRDIGDDDGAGTDDRSLTNLNPVDNHCANADVRATSHDYMSAKTRTRANMRSFTDLTIVVHAYTGIENDIVTYACTGVYYDSGRSHGSHADHRTSGNGCARMNGRRKHKSVLPCLVRETKARIAIAYSDDEMSYTRSVKRIKLLQSTEDLSSTERSATRIGMYIIEKPDDLVLLTLSNYIGDYRGMSASAPNGEWFQHISRPNGNRSRLSIAGSFDHLRGARALSLARAQSHTPHQLRVLLAIIWCLLGLISRNCSCQQ
jgi:hypothetical protein